MNLLWLSHQAVARNQPNPARVEPGVRFTFVSCLLGFHEKIARPPVKDPRMELADVHVESLLSEPGLRAVDCALRWLIRGGCQKKGIQKWLIPIS